MQQGSKNRENVGLGIDLGGTKIAGALFNSEGMASPKKVLYLENKIGQQVVEQIFKLIQSFLDWSSKNNMQINTIGMAVPGIYYSKAGRVWAPNIPGWEDYPLFEELTSKFDNMDFSFRYPFWNSLTLELKGSWSRMDSRTERDLGSR